MKYFIYDKTAFKIACFCIVTNENTIKNTKTVSLNYSGVLTKKHLEKEWPWINSEGSHIFLYKGDSFPEEFIQYKNILELSLKEDTPEFFNISTNSILKLENNQIDLAINKILLQAYIYFTNNPERVIDFEVFNLYVERNNMQNYMIEDFMNDMDEVFLKI